MMKLSEDSKIDAIMAKIDNKEPSVVTWNEFLDFLDKETVKRDKINDALLYGKSVKRMQLREKASLRVSKNQKEEFIQNCVFIRRGKNLKLMLCILDKSVKLVDLSTNYKIVQELKFENDAITRYLEKEKSVT